MDAPTITIGKHPVTLVKPSPMAALAITRDASAIEAMSPAESIALGCTALAICWPADKTWCGKVPPRKWRPSTRVDDYGQGVFDDLMAAGAGISAIVQAGGAAYNWALSTLVAADEVAAQKDFSEAPAGG